MAKSGDPLEVPCSNRPHLKFPDSTSKQLKKLQKSKISSTIVFIYWKAFFFVRNSVIYVDTIYDK